MERGKAVSLAYTFRPSDGPKRDVFLIHKFFHLHTFFFMFYERTFGGNEVRAIFFHGHKWIYYEEQIFPSDGNAK